MRQRPASRLHAFTLVELLVVIGIIALLMSILLPALNRARQQATRVKCLSNTRQLAQALNIYAVQFRDACPIGIVNSPIPASPGPTTPVTGVNTTDGNIQSAFSYFAFWKNSGGQRVTGLGMLTRVKMLKTSPLAYFCPSEEREGVSYSEADPNNTNNRNPWAYRSDPPSAHRHTYLSYWVRPTAAYPAVDESHPGADTPFLLEGYYTASGATAPRGWPKFAKLKSKAIISCLARGPADIRAGHRRGISVAYADGSGKLVELRDFENAQYSATSSGPFGGGTTTVAWKNQAWITAIGQGNPPADYASNAMYLDCRPGSANKQQGFWNLLDRAK